MASRAIDRIDIAPRFTQADADALNARFRGVDAVERAIEQYRSIREPGERFIDTYRRVGMDGFKEAIYG